MTVGINLYAGNAILGQSTCKKRNTLLKGFREIKKYGQIRLNLEEHKLIQCSKIIQNINLLKEKP